MSLLNQLFGDPEKSTALGLLAAYGMAGKAPQGLLAATEHMAGADERATKKKLGLLQLAELEAKVADNQAQREWRGSLPSPEMLMSQQALAGGGGPTPQNAARIQPVSPNMQLLWGGMRAGTVTPEAYIKATQPGDSPFGKVDAKDFSPESIRTFVATGGRDYSVLQPVRKMELGPGGQAYNPWTVQPGTIMNDPLKPFTVGPGGQLVPNKPVQDYELNRSRAGATNVSVNTEKSYGGEVGKLFAQQDAATIEAARSAPQRIQTAHHVMRILDSQAPITGSGADARLAINKAFSTAGLIDGQSVKSTEDLASLLASQTLDAIKTSGLGGGQGFTDKDREFLERAKSGNIQMNPGTLRTLAQLNDKSARATIARARDVGKRLQGNKDLGWVSQGLDVADPPAYAGPSIMRQPQPAAAASAPGRVRFLGFE